MSVPIVLSKGCVPELSLVGSRVAVLDPLCYHGYRPSQQAVVLDPALSILPGISPLSRHGVTPPATLTFCHGNQAIREHSRINSAQSCGGSLHTSQTSPSEMVLKHNLHPTNNECWTSKLPYTDVGVLSHTMRLERFKLTSQKPLMPPVDVSGLYVSKHHTWHDELRRESSKHSHCLEQGQDEEILSQSSTASASQHNNKHRKEKRKKRKKKSKVHANKLTRSKVRSSSAGRPGQQLSLSNYHGNDNCTISRRDNNEGAFVITQCKTKMKIIQSPPPKVNKPKLIAHSTAKLTMGSVSSTTTATHSSPQRQEPVRTNMVIQEPARTDLVNHRTIETHHPPARLVKVYCSDKQSGVVKILGQEIPCAPPATPMPEMLERYEYVPSMADIRSQRAIKIRLEALDKVAKKKHDKLLEEKQKQAKAQNKMKEKDLKKRQRQEIYALNTLMTDFEYGNFIAFCEKNGVAYMNSS